MYRVGYVIEEIIKESNMDTSFRQVLRGTDRKHSHQGSYLLAHKPEVLAELTAQIAAGTFQVKDYPNGKSWKVGNCGVFRFLQ